MNMFKSKDHASVESSSKAARSKSKASTYNSVMYKGGKWRKWAYNAILNENVY